MMDINIFQKFQIIRKKENLLFNYMIEKIEKLIIDWLNSDNENTTYIAHKICASFDINREKKTVCSVCQKEYWFNYKYGEYEKQCDCTEEQISC